MATENTNDTPESVAEETSKKKVSPKRSRSKKATSVEKKVKLAAPPVKREKRDLSRISNINRPYYT